MLQDKSNDAFAPSKIDVAGVTHYYFLTDYPAAYLRARCLKRRHLLSNESLVFELSDGPER